MFSLPKLVKSVLFNVVGDGVVSIIVFIMSAAALHPFSLQQIDRPVDRKIKECNPKYHKQKRKFLQQGKLLKNIIFGTIY